MIIAGAIDQSFTPTTSGNYAVQITTCNDIDTSVCTNMIITGMNELNTSTLRISPNPVKSLLKINPDNLAITKIHIIDITGKIVKSIVSKQKIVNVENLKRGIYFLQIHSNQGIINTKFIKE